MVSRIRAVIDRRGVLWTLVVRDLRVRYSRSALGYLWTILDPLLLALVYLFVFGYIFNGKHRGDSPYLLFLLCGLLPWQWFSGAMNDTARSLLESAKLVRSTNVPRELWVLRIVIAKGIEFLYSLPVLVGFVVYFVWRGEAHIDREIVFFPLAVALEFFLLVGIGLILAPVTVLVTDVQRVVRIFLRFFLYLSPVIWALHAVPPTVGRIIALNPLTGILDLYRGGLFARAIDWNAVGVSVAVTAVILLAGLWTFARLERAVLKEI